ARAPLEREEVPSPFEAVETEGRAVVVIDRLRRSGEALRLVRFRAVEAGFADDFFAVLLGERL
ncbi:MAG: hypothetical protein ABI041_17920, partial [Bdellovibrionia bacterium]